MRVIIFFVLFALTVNANVTVNGRVTTDYGRPISNVYLRLQATACYDTEPEVFYVYEIETRTNTFGYYQLSIRSDCHVYSVRILGGRKYSEENFIPFFYAFGNPNKEDLTLENQDFLYIH